jgi:hypothetical protein
MFVTWSSQAFKRKKSAHLVIIASFISINVFVLPLDMSTFFFFFFFFYRIKHFLSRRYIQM